MISLSGIPASEATGVEVPYEFDVSDADFVIPEVWEGPAEELHLNDLTAAETVFGRRILSGITSMIRALPPVLCHAGWQWPSEVSWGFNSPVFAEDHLISQWRATVAPGGQETWEAVVARADGTRVSAGSVSYDTSPTPASASGAAAIASPGRTLFSADNELLMWWLDRDATYRLPALAPGEVAWPLFISLGGGLAARVELGGHDADDAVNRAMEWTFRQPLHVGDSVRGFLHTRSERRSGRSPGWSVRQVTCDFHSEGASSAHIASLRWTLMLYRHADVTSGRA